VEALFDCRVAGTAWGFGPHFADIDLTMLLACRSGRAH
jgi:hypothetical protein